MNDRPEIHIPTDETMHELRRTNIHAFAQEADILAKESEDMRLRYMQSHQERSFIATTLSVFIVVIGCAAFGWLFLVDNAPILGSFCLIPSLIPPIFLNFWARRPLKTYARDYKRIYLPKMAQALGGFHYRPLGGIGAKVLPHTGIVPEHDHYESEDCFLGHYKGIKVIFSEARLYKYRQPLFKGMFILLELSRPILEDRIVITGDKTLAHRYAQTRWKDLSRVAATTSNPDWNRFLIFSNHPANASSVTNEKLLKELSEASDIFGKAALSVSMFEEKYIFMMIPYFEDMFEASKFQEAITTRESAHMRRAEIDKLMEVIDVFDVYANKDNVEAAFDDASKPARAG